MKRIFLLICILLFNAVSGFSKPDSTIRVKVMSYNIHHANPPAKPGVIDLDAISDVIRTQNPDVVALQEVDVNTGRSGKVNQAEAIARKLNMEYFFAKAIDHDGGEYGVAILSKYNITDPKFYKLPTDSVTGGEHRVLATVKLVLPGGKIIGFANTHLDAQKDHKNRLLQIKQINRILNQADRPFVIAGDLNAAPGTEVIEIFDQAFKRSCRPCEPTFPVLEPQDVIDFIGFTRNSNIQAVNHQVIMEHYASDHLPVTAVLTVD
jgi:endonuclease/exonuclease/phosphatase family metal-dependent hydrolase